MGQTLTHGIYLPDEGERNCYNGLAANWSILDGAVGTIAEHSTQIAGKAPLVHTHSKSDITDFPVYGNTAGTICEGNDSRLSDARTPVAHTHTKSDVTDLFNSANTWTNEQTCGSNSPKWVNKNNNLTIGIAPASNQTCAFYNYDKDGNEIGRLISRVQSDGKTLTWVSATNLYKNGAIDPTGSSVWANLYCAVDANGYPHVSTDCDLTPNVNNTYNLGTSTNKWKTFNGINPGALSLPDYTLAKVDLIDFRQWSVAGQPNAYTPISDGWLFVSIKDTASNSLFIYAHGLYNADPTKTTDYSASCFGNGSQGLDGRIAVMLPVRAGIVYRIYIKAASVSEIYSAKFYPALGNV